MDATDILTAAADGPPVNLNKPFPIFGAKGITLAWVYNLEGKVLVAMDSVDEPFLLSTYDAAALQRMVKLGYEIRAHGIALKDIPSFMHQHPEWATHPVDGKEFDFNPMRGRLSFRILAHWRKNADLGIPVWQAASPSSTVEGK